MSIKLITSLEDQKRTDRLLDKSVPSYRQAYSDRTAWLMACLSELAYLKFNPLFPGNNQKWFLDNIKKLAGDGASTSLMKLIDIIGYDHEEEKRQLEKNLDVIKIRLEETFDADGTQAILVSSEKFIAVAFRGTEATSIKDIKADAKAKIIHCESGGKIHMGFEEAFGNVAVDIQSTVDRDEFSTKPLFIAGHSLGGALATIATKELKHKGGIAACYTFGSPRVGNDEWVSNIKAPIYRVVNAADCVTMLPPGDEIVTFITWVLRGVAWFRVPLISRLAASFSRVLFANFAGYLHCGDMRYMTDCKKGKHDAVQMLYSVSLFRRIKGWVVKKAPWKKFLADHSISVYRNKLMIIAERRNQQDG